MQAYANLKQQLGDISSLPYEMLGEVLHKHARLNHEWTNFGSNANKSKQISSMKSMKVKKKQFQKLCAVTN